MKISRSGRVALIKTCTKWQVGRLRAALLLPTSGGAPKGRAGRPAIHGTSGGVPFQRCGFKKKPSRTEQEKLGNARLFPVLFLEQGLHKLLIDLLQLLFAVQCGELFLAVLHDHLQDDETGFLILILGSLALLVGLFNRKKAM